mmetsp:Transcript_24155/g.34001  ORF Transcript_24155/g.34001 Transcript_24155/m.34001 type:complete len:143 (+) Transcript_24155:230-658(+)
MNKATMMSSIRNNQESNPSASPLKAWTSDMRKAGDNLSFAASELESMFEELSIQAISLSKEEQLSRGSLLEEEEDTPSASSSSSIPNPIILLRRLAALEYSIQRIHNDGFHVSQKRDEILEELIERQNQNRAILNQISARLD